jgi:hypothetical protein
MRHMPQHLSTTTTTVRRIEHAKENSHLVFSEHMPPKNLQRMRLPY